MTGDEATKTIDYLKEDYKELLTEEDIEALDMAVEALKQVTDKLNNPDDSLLIADSEACKEQKSKLDLISRAEAIEAVCDGCAWYKTASCEEGKEEWECSEVNKIRHLPSADRPKGEWIETAQDYYETVNKKGGGVNENTEYFTDDIACSECLTKFSNIDNETERFNFCPNCGADMRGNEK